MGIKILENFFGGIKFGIRSLARTPGFSFTVVLTLGITLAMFLCVITLNHLLVTQPLPYPEQGRLFAVDQVYLDESGAEQKRYYTFPSIKHVYKNALVKGKAAMVDYAQDIITSHEEQSMVFINYTTPEYGKIFGVAMAKGRFLSDAEGLAEQQHNVVISYETWKNLYDLRDDILGVKIKFAGKKQFKIVGVVAENFNEPQLHQIGRKTHIWVPWQFNLALNYWGWSNNVDSAHLVMRMNRAERDVLTERISEDLNNKWQSEVVGGLDNYSSWRTAVVTQSLKEKIVGDSDRVVLMILVAVVGLLLIACVNIVNLYLSRVAQQQSSWAIRAVVGAKQSDLFKLVLVEATVLVLFSTLVGLLLSHVGMVYLKNNFAMVLPRIVALKINYATLASAVFIVVMLAWVFSKAAVSMINYDKLKSYIASGKGAGIQIPTKVRGVLIVSQVTLASSLIVICLLVFKTNYDQVLKDKGFNVNNLSNAYLIYSDFDDSSPEFLKAEAMAQKDKLSSLPMVELVSQSHSPLQKFIETNVSSSLTGENYPIAIKRIDHKYIDMVGQHLIAGENFTSSDVRNNNKVMLVNEALAQKLEKEKKVIGLQLKRGKTNYTVKGVVNDVDFPNEKAKKPRAYLIASESGFNFVIKLKTGKTLSRKQLVESVSGTSAHVDVFLYDSLEAQLANTQFMQLVGIKLAIYSLVAVVLMAVMGLFGVINYSVVLRQYEIGVRLAIGGKYKHMLVMIIKDVLSYILKGLVFSCIILFMLYMYSLNWGVMSGVIPSVTWWLSIFLIMTAVIALILLLVCRFSLRRFTKSPIKSFVN
ncbi:ABC transporter permease [Marinicella rhabdoformis]|uniref:ABC transporter permease n=1 Tax=Marinicella rhabdoformis TaxID=2580566 RepID=UPI0012AEB935|nr:ABC transporter permease [Marinicella rhabdoformis]